MTETINSKGNIMIAITHTPDEFTRWLNTANPGDWAEYYRAGSLWHDGPGLRGSRLTDGRGNLRRTATAALAWKAHELGSVILAQRKNTEFDISYLMQAQGGRREPAKRKVVTT